MGDYHDLLAWQRARALAGAVYRATESFPVRERFGLASQMRRSAISVVSNIAEGAGRSTDPELRRFLQIARGSLQELQTQITIAGDLQLLMGAPAEALALAAEETGRIVQGLLHFLSRKS